MRLSLVFLCLLITLSSKDAEAKRGGFPSVSGTAWVMDVDAVYKDYLGKSRGRYVSIIEFDGMSAQSSAGFYTEWVDDEIVTEGVWFQRGKKISVSVDQFWFEYVESRWSDDYFVDTGGALGAAEIAKWSVQFRLDRRGFLKYKEQISGKLYTTRGRFKMKEKYKGVAVQLTQ